MFPVTVIGWAGSYLLLDTVGTVPFVVYLVSNVDTVGSVTVTDPFVHVFGEYVKLPWFMSATSSILPIVISISFVDVTFPATS